MGKIHTLKANHVKVRASLDYEAEGKEHLEISISYDNFSQTMYVNIQNYSIVIAEYPEYNSYCQCAIEINNTLEVISTFTPSVQINISNGYIITQYFDYSETYGSLAAFGGGAAQIIVLNQSRMPKLILSKPTGGWIS